MTTAHSTTASVSRTGAESQTLPPTTANSRGTTEDDSRADIRQPKDGGRRAKMTKDERTTAVSRCYRGMMRVVGADVRVFIISSGVGAATGTLRQLVIERLPDRDATSASPYVTSR